MELQFLSLMNLRLARVIVNEEQAKEIEKYYKECSEEGSNPEQIEQSKKDMSKMSKLLANPRKNE